MNYGTQGNHGFYNKYFRYTLDDLEKSANRVVFLHIFLSGGSSAVENCWW